MHRIIFASAALAAIASAPAGAAIVYQNNFDGENGGAAANDYDGFNGLYLPFAQSDGDSVDLIADGDSGRRCAGGHGLCVDLDGAHSSQLRTIDAFAFNAGDFVTLRFAASGSQVAASPLDEAVYRFRFTSPTAGSYYFTSTGGATDGGDFDGNFITVAVAAPYTLGFENVTFGFRATNAGSFRVSFDDYTPGDGDADDDGFGRLIDDISIDVSPAPEPATWGMMILGFGIVGAAARRRRGVGVVAASGMLSYSGLAGRLSRPSRRLR